MFATWIPCCKSVTNADKGEGVKNPNIWQTSFLDGPVTKLSGVHVGVSIVVSWYIVPDK